MDAIKNFVKVEVSTGYDSAATSVVLKAGDGAKLPDPATANYNLVWWNSTDYADPADDPYVSIVRVTGKSTDTLTVVQPSSATGNNYNGETSSNTAQNHNIADKVYKMALAPTYKVFNDLVPKSLIAAKGDLVVGSAASTPAILTVGANNKIPIAASGEATGLKWDYVGSLINAPEGFLINGKIVPSATVPTIDNNLGSTASDLGFETDYWYAQPFTTGAGITALDLCTFQLKKTGSPTGNMTIEIQSDNAGSPSGTVLYTTTLDVATLTTAYATYAIFPRLTVTAATKYHFCWKGQDAWAAGTTVTVGFASGSGLPTMHYGAGNFASSSTSLTLNLKTYVNAGDLTVAIKGMGGNDPSSTNPVYCRIGDTVRSITAALSVTKNAGTNWFNSGSTKLAMKEIDYFVYLGYNATDGVVVGFSRRPHGHIYSDFSATTTDEKYCAISTITNAAAGDNYVNVGRFAATLSATVALTWTVPTFTGINLIQRPIYTTRWLSYTPALYASTTDPILGSSPIQTGRYMIIDRMCIAQAQIAFGSSGANAGSGDYRPGLPVNAGGETANHTRYMGSGFAYDATGSTYPLAVAVVYNIAADRVWTMYYANAAVTHAAPVGWTTNDTFGITISYEVS